MGVVNRQNVISVKPGTTVFAGGQSIYRKSASGDPQLLVKEGEFVAYDPRTQKSLDATSISSVDEVVLAVGWGRSRYGTAKTLRGTTIAGHDSMGIRSCDITAATAEPFKCGQNAVKDIEFDCIKPDKAYTFYIGVEDYLSESFFPEHFGRKRYYTATTNVCNCEPDCSPRADCTDLLADFADQINGISKFTDDPHVGQWFEVSPQDDLPFYAFVRRQYSTQYCLTPSDATCDTCTYLPLPTGITISGNTTTFEGLESSEDGLMERDLVPYLLDQINAALVDGEGNSIGTATASGSTGKCCNVQIEINTSVEGVTLNGEGIESCGSEDFGTEGCALRVVAKPIDLECMCDDALANIPIKNKLRELEIDVVGDGWVCQSHEIIEVQKPKAPINLGYDWAEIDYKSANGGEGRTHDDFNNYRGRFKQFDAQSRAANIGHIKCSEGYCSITLESVPVYLGNFQTDHRGVPVRNHIIVQQGDTANILAIQEIVNAFIASPKCPVFKTVECIDPDGNVIDPASEVTGYGGHDTTHGFEASVES